MHIGGVNGVDAGDQSTGSVVCGAWQWKGKDLEHELGDGRDLES